MAPELMSEEKAASIKKVEGQEREKGRAPGTAADLQGLASLQRRIGNRAVQRVLAQRSGDGSFDLDEATAGRIKAARAGGQALESNVGESLGSAMGTDLGGVRVHTSPEADDLSRGIGARAFTTGQDIFFREGAYNPHTSDGQKTIAHELTHVAQQGSGVGGGVGRMTVGPAADAYEQEADSVANSLVGTGLQMQPVQSQELPEEEELQKQRAQRQELPEEEEPIQTQVEEEEEMLQPQAEEEEPMPGDKFLSAGMGRGLATGGGQGPVGIPAGAKEEERLQMQVEPEEEEEEILQTQVEEEEALQTQAAEEEEEPAVQMQEEEEEEEEPVQAKREEEDLEVVGA